MKNKMLPEVRNCVKYINKGSHPIDHDFTSYTWRKGWIKPCESLYSVFCMFERLNGFTTTGAFKIINKKNQIAIGPDFAQSFISSACNGVIETTHISYRCVAEFFSTGDDDIPSFPAMNAKARILLTDSCYVFCPKCHAIGYHSWIFQYRALKFCPIHSIPLESLTHFFLEKKVGVMDSHPMLYEIDTKKIEYIYHKLSLDAKRIDLITMNNCFNIREYGQSFQMEPLLNIGEEIYQRNERDYPDVEKEMSSRFRKVICEVSSIINRRWTEEHTQVILADTFDRNMRHKKNPSFQDTMAASLQVYITLMEIKLQHREKNILDEIFDRYMCYVQGVYDPLEFRRFYHPYSSEPYELKSTANVKEIELTYINLATLNENDITLCAIDDHIRFQWAEYRKLVMEDHIDVDEAAKRLPDVAYICITDADGILHVKRIVTDNVVEK